MVTYFGGASTGVFPYDASFLAQCEPYIKVLANKFNACMYVYGIQVHGVEGLRISLDIDSGMIQKQSDYLITDQKGILLSVLTADCVPLILYDPVRLVVAIVHAGWKGSFAGIIKTVLSDLATYYGCAIKNLIALFGPAARGCCYQVQEDFIARYRDVTKDKSSLVGLIHRENSFYFEQALYLKEQLYLHGILKNNAMDNSAMCTICNHAFFSYRRNGAYAGRNISCVML